MKTEWLVTNVTVVESPDRVERAIVGVILVGLFWSIQDAFVVGEPLRDVGSPS